jgi:hypothetical protein
MLNCCIEHRLRHENDTINVENLNEQDEDDDQFYECSSNITSLKSNLTELQPEGRLKPCGDLKLLTSDEILYVPITQVSFRRRKKTRIYTFELKFQFIGMSTSY